jgi:acetyltransferase-like isoleucine patch superfamily enzyme
MLATSAHPAARAARRARRALLDLSLPMPRLLAPPVRLAFLCVRSAWYFALRVFVAEPLFKAQCTRYGKHLHTGIFVHFITGQGRIEIGDDVTIDGKIGIGFAARFASRPALRIGSHVYIGHSCSFTVAKSVSIGDHCYLAGNVTILDSPGHPLDPEARKAGSPPADEDVQPVAVGDNVWIAQRAIIMPGVTIGEGSVVAAGAIVTHDVPPNTLVAGVPARVVKRLSGETAPPAD